MVVDSGQQPGGPAAADQTNLGALQADLASLLKGDAVLLGQPGQAGDRKLVVALLDGEGNGPLDQALDPRGDGRLKGSSGHTLTLDHAPDGPGPDCSLPTDSGWLPGDDVCHLTSYWAVMAR